MAAVVASKVSRARKEKNARLQQEKENLERDPNDISKAEAYIAKQKKLLQGGKDQPKRLRPNSDGKFEAGSPGENVILYIGLGMICIGLVIMCVGLGDKGFKTLELKLVGPVFIGCGMFFTLLRILICTMPDSWKTCFKCCCSSSEEKEKLIKKENQKFKALSGGNDGKESKMKSKPNKRIVINNNININFQNNTNINYQNTTNGGIKMSAKPSPRPNHSNQTKPIKQTKPNHPVFISDEDLMTVAELSIDSFKSNSSMGRPIKFNQVGAEDSTTVSCSSISDDHHHDDDQEYHHHDTIKRSDNLDHVHNVTQIEGSRVNINSAEILINASKLNVKETMAASQEV